MLRGELFERHAQTAYRSWWHGAHRWRGWCALLAGGVATVVGLARTADVSRDCSGLHLALQMAGTPAELAWLTLPCYANGSPLRGFSVTHMLVADIFLIAGYTTVFTALIIAGWWRFEAHILRRCGWVIYLPAAAAIADLIEDLLLYLVVAKSDDGTLSYSYPLAAQWLLLTSALTKWMLLFATAVVLVMATAVVLGRASQAFPPIGTNELPIEPGLATPAETTKDPSRRADLRRTVDTGVATSRDNARLDPEMAEQQQNGMPAVAPRPGERGVVGICLSGGGIRATAFSLGVLQTLEVAPSASLPGTKSPLKAARYLSAVSGGSWAACAWTLQKIGQQEANAAATVIAGLQSDAPAGYQRQKYLMNGRGGVLGPLWWVLLCAFVNLAGIGSIVFLIAWPLGYFQTFCAVSDTALGPSEHCGSGPPIPDANHLRFLEPSAVLATAGLIALIVCGFGFRTWARKWPVGAGLLLLAVLTLVYLIGLPWAFHNLANGTLTFAVLGSAIGASGTIAVVGGVWRVLGGPVMKRVSNGVGSLLPKLLGLVLLVGVAAWALVVMYCAATEDWGPWSLTLPVAYSLGAFVFFSPNWPTIHVLYSHRLRRSFDPTAGQPFHSQPLTARSTAGEMAGRTRDLTRVRWQDLAGKTRTHVNPDNLVPELILCCAQQRHGLAPGGLRADTFTISPLWVRQGYRSVPTTRYLERARTVGWRAKLNRLDVDHVSAWMATSGAAVASAMGRSSLGSTNALLAAINADLGIWLPNLHLVQSHPEYRFRRPTFGHLGKEIFGLYGAHDRYVFITDGGHWDNLGLVELLRRRCDEIYCIDSSGDPPFSFDALRQSLTLASLELDDCHELDVDLNVILRDLKPQNADDLLPRTNVVTFRIEISEAPAGPPQDCSKVRDMRTVTIHYLKLQASQDMGVSLRRYAIADPKFPRYSTAQQVLTPQQFANLVEVGTEAGTKLLEKRSAGARKTAPSPPEGS